MTIILSRNEPADDRVISQANLVVRKQLKSYRVIKNRHGKLRKVVRADDLLDFVNQQN